LKAITVQQPFAAALLGPKRYENRPRPLSYQGPLLIHAGLSRASMSSMSPEQLATWPDYDQKALTFGAIIGVVVMRSCQHKDQISPGNPWVVGPFCYYTIRPHRFERPIPWKGALGLFEVDTNAVIDQLPAWALPSEVCAPSPTSQTQQEQQS
jgi:hypothetical protein